MLEQILTGDCRDILPTLPAQSVQCCVTSPPYWGLRDYGTAQWEGGEEGCDHVNPNGSHPNSSLAELADKYAPRKNPRNPVDQDTNRLISYRDVCGTCGARRIDAQLGLEATPQEYIAKMVAVFREVWRVLRDDGTLWLNLGDSYASSGGNGDAKSGLYKCAEKWDGIPRSPASSLRDDMRGTKRPNTANNGLKPKDLCMMPARVALALQADGWYLRSDIIWHKPNPMPESVTDRPTKSHEYIFLLAKQEHYFYDAEAIREPVKSNSGLNMRAPKLGDHRRDGNYNTVTAKTYDEAKGSNRRTVWTIATQPYSEAHFATFPEEIPKLCILAGSKPGDTVLDPFAGSGTTGQVALELGRKAILIELNPAYIELARARTFTTPGFL